MQVTFTNNPKKWFEQNYPNDEHVIFYEQVDNGVFKFVCQWPYAATPPTEVEIEASTLDEVRAAKLTEINAAFERAGAGGHVMSSLGFEIDANERANRDTEGLITVLSATGAAGTIFCDYNNVMREVTLNDLKTIRLEIIAHGQALYAKKWLLREAVNAAQTVAEVQAVAWED